MSQIYHRSAAIDNMSLVAGSAPFNAAVLALFTNDFHPTQLSLLADFTEADFNTYVPPLVALGAFAYDPTTGLAVASQAALFQPTDDVKPNTIYGWYMRNDPATDWYAAERFSDPVQLATPSDVLEFFARIFSGIVMT